jgi:hypothetical protein
MSDNTLFVGLFLIWGAIVCPVAIWAAWDICDAVRRYLGR